MFVGPCIILITEE